MVRYAVGLAALLGEELRLTNIRASRDRPGLRPQHLRAVEAVAQLCEGRLEGARVGSREMWFAPGGRIRAGRFEWDIGTAGSATMHAMTLLPLACFAPGLVRVRISGGLFQDFAPSAYHMQRALLPTMEKMGVRAKLDIVRPGYVPAGEGIVEMEASPSAGKLARLHLGEQGHLTGIEGVALSSRLRERRVSDRMASECQRALRAAGLSASVESTYDDTARQAGAALALFAYTDTGCILGADCAGAPRRSSEQIARHVARSLMDDLASGATVDRFLADQLVMWAALADGTSRYRVPRRTEHLEANLWLVETILGAKSRLADDLMLEIDGVGYSRSA